VLAGLLGGVDWSAVRSIMGGSDFVPGSLDRLLSATSQDAATTAYWELDNRVVVQGQLFPAAQWVIGPLLSALQAGLPLPARQRVVDLLVEIALGAPDESELALGNDKLDDACRREFRQGTWGLYGLLEDEDPTVRIGAVEILDAVEVDRERLLRVAAEIAQRDTDAETRSRAAQVRRTGGPEP
jgi:hypothetical protein